MAFVLTEFRMLIAVLAPADAALRAGCHDCPDVWCELFRHVHLLLLQSTPTFIVRGIMLARRYCQVGYLLNGQHRVHFYEDLLSYGPLHFHCICAPEG